MKFECTCTKACVLKTETIPKLEILIGKQVKRIAELKARNKRLKEQGRWIPVEERLPKTRQRCYVFYKSEYGKNRITVADYIAPKTVKEEDYLSEDCIDFAEYDEQNDCYWTPAGWYESSWESDMNWFITPPILKWKPITLPESEE